MIKQTDEELEKILDLYIQGVVSDDEYKDALVKSAQNGQDAALAYVDGLKAENTALREERGEIEKEVAEYYNILRKDFEEHLCIIENKYDHRLSKVRLISASVCFALFSIYMIAFAITHGWLF